MTDKRKALGRGLETLLPSRTAMQPPAPVAATGAQTATPPPPHASGDAIRHLPLDLLDHNPYQTRSHIDDAGLAELADSIKVSGVFQPVTVRPGQDGRFMLIAGERRWLASQLAGKSTIPAIVRHVSNEQAMEMTIVENLQREDLSPMEQARAFRRLSEEFSLTQEQIAERTGKDRSTVANFLRLLRLPDDIQAMLLDGKLTFGHAKALMTLGSPPWMLDMARRAVEEALSVRQLEREVGAFLRPAEPPEPKPERMIDPNVSDAEYRLRSALGMKVAIHDRRGKGRVVIHYHNLDEFDRILQMLAK